MFCETSRQPKRISKTDFSKLQEGLGTKSNSKFTRSIIIEYGNTKNHQDYSTPEECALDKIVCQVSSLHRAKQNKPHVARIRN